MLDFLLLVLTDIPILADILRDYTLEFEIRVERALANLKWCLREAVRDNDCCREIADTLMEMSSMQESELVALKAKLDWSGLAPSSIEAECVQLRSRVVGLDDELAALTRRFAALDHTWDEKRAALEASKAKANSRADDLALELL